MTHHASPGETLGTNLFGLLSSHVLERYSLDLIHRLACHKDKIVLREKGLSYAIPTEKAEKLDFPPQVPNFSILDYRLLSISHHVAMACCPQED